ncbi:hypothetical protein [Tissierella sp.]|uniref:hypothetical protein n=1 Tax=Tissierella sp. TaxID=41274 RepID=UPI0028AAE066|nr:hypothetical protein [Tissierella sp.]
MKNNLKILSILAFVAAIPSLIITDWHYKGYGILVMFMFLTIGLVLDQVIRLKFPMLSVTPIGNYQKNKLINIFALILFVQSPIGLIFGNKIYPNLGFWLLIIMICVGVSSNHIARIKYQYSVENVEENL